MSFKMSYDNTFKLLEEVLRKGVNPCHLQIAWALSEELEGARVYLGRSAKARRRLKDDTEGLFRLAVEVYLSSSGATTEREAARGVVDAYMRCGMDLDKARIIAKTEEFVLGRKEEES